jgi:hypothetical protein
MRTFLARAAAFVAGAFALNAPAAAQVAAQKAQTAITVDSLERALNALRAQQGDVGGTIIPAVDKFSFGDRTVAAGTRVDGPIGIAFGTLHVRGTVEGDVVSYGGDIDIHEGGAVHGNALAILGTVTDEAGHVSGDVRTLAGDLGALPAGPTSVARTAQRPMKSQLALAGGWLGVLVIVGIGVLLFASTNLDAVGVALERDFGRALIAGIGTQLALLPALALVVLGLALTILGILLIPFAIVAYVVAAAGLVTLGYLAIARLTGALFFRDPEKDASQRARRAAALKAMLYGLLVLMAPWLVAASLAWSPRGELIARTIALAITWVAASAGLGAAMISRGGVRRLSAAGASAALSASSWQTPTPVAGVVAARRPASAGARK